MRTEITYLIDTPMDEPPATIEQTREYLTAGIAQIKADIEELPNTEINRNRVFDRLNELRRSVEAAGWPITCLYVEVK